MMAGLLKRVMERQHEVQEREGREEEEEKEDEGIGSVDSSEEERDRRENRTSDEKNPIETGHLLSSSSSSLPPSHLRSPARSRRRRTDSNVFSSSSSAVSRLSPRRRRVSTDLNRKKKVFFSRSSLGIKMAFILLVTSVFLLLTRVSLSHLRACLASSGVHTPHHLTASSSSSHRHSRTATSPAHRRLSSSSFHSLEKSGEEEDEDRLVFSSIVKNRTKTRVPWLRLQSPERFLSPSSPRRRLSSSLRRSATFPSFAFSYPEISSSFILSSPSTCIEIGAVIDEEEGREDAGETGTPQSGGSLISRLKRRISLLARGGRSFASRSVLSIALVSGFFLATRRDSELYSILSVALISISSLALIFLALPSLRVLDWIRTLRDKRERENKKKRKTSSRTSVSRLTDKWRAYYYKLIAEYTASSRNDSTFDEQGRLLSPDEADDDEVLPEVFERLKIRVSPRSESEEGSKDSRVKEEIEEDPDEEKEEEQEQRREVRRQSHDEVFSVSTADTEDDGDGELLLGALTEIV